MEKIHFSDFPNFTPNLTPSEIFKFGSFGGTYWRPIHSSITGKNYQNIHTNYPKEWWYDIPENYLTNSWEDYDKYINLYKVKVGTDLAFWESKKWITKFHPYGWVHWYCDFYLGRRCEDDERQIDRWSRIAGHKGRFFKQLVNLITKKNSSFNNESISPKIRQTLQHWAYKLTEEDFLSYK